VVGDLAIYDIRHGLAREEETVEGGQAKLGAAIIVSQHHHHQPQPGKKVGVARADALLRQPPQSRHRVVFAVALSG